MDTNSIGAAVTKATGSVASAADKADLNETSLPALPLGVMVYDDGIDADRLLAETARVLAQSGYKLGGVVQSNADRPGRRKCAMHLTDLLSGEQIQISYDLGEEAKGCRLDPEGLVRAGLGVERALTAGVDLLIINKFGKQEAQGEGLRSVIAEALLSDIPVVMGVSQLNLDACREFAGGPFTRLVPDQDAVVAWCRQIIRRSV
jgi:nucleoside-triphosphatase THEP1